MLSPNFQGTELQEYKEEKYTLIQAVSDKLLKKAAALLDRGNVKAIDPDSGDSVFHIAIRQADKDDGAMLELLLSHANMIRFLHTRNKNNLSPAELAIVREDLVVLQKIITQCDQVSPFQDNYGALLSLAVFRNNYQIAEWLLKFKNAEPNVPFDDGDYCLHLAIRKLNMDMLVLLLASKKINLKLQNTREGIEPVRLAARLHFFQGVKTLLHSIGEIAESERENYKSVLLRAVRYQNLGSGLRNPTIDAVIEQLLKQKISLRVSSTAEHGDMPLHAAVRNNDIQTLGLLLNSTADDVPALLDLENEQKLTPIELAAHLLHFDCVKRILEKTGPMEGEKLRKHIQLTASLGFFEEAKEMLSAVSEIAERDRIGYQSVLFAAVKEHNWCAHPSSQAEILDSIIHQLIQQKVPLFPLSEDARNQESVFHAVINQKNKKTLELLLKTSNEDDLIDALWQIDKDGLIPLRLAGHNEFFEGISMIIERVPSIVNKQSNKLGGVLARAVKAQNIFIVEKLLEGSVYTEATLTEDKKADRCLHTAVRNNDEKMVNLLLQYNADVFANNADQLAPHELAAKLGYWKIFKMICETNDKDFLQSFREKLKDSLSRAVEAGRVDVVNLLISKGVRPHSICLHLAVKICSEPMIHLLLHAGMSIRTLNGNNLTPRQYAVHLDKLNSSKGAAGDGKKYVECFDRVYTTYKTFKERKPAEPEDKKFKDAAVTFLDLFKKNKIAPTFFQSHSNETAAFVTELREILDDANSTADTIRMAVKGYLDARKDKNKPSDTIDFLDASGLMALVNPEAVVIHTVGMGGIQQGLKKQ